MDSKTQEEPTVPNFKKLRGQTTDLSEQANELMKLIRPLTGVIYIITFDDLRLKPSKVSHLSATILKDGRILTAFHALMPLIKALENEKTKNKRFLLFFIPANHVYDFQEDAWDFGERKKEPSPTFNQNNEFWDKLPGIGLSSSANTEPSTSTILNSTINLEEFLREVHSILIEANKYREEYQRKNHLLSITEDYGRVQLPNEEEIKLFASKKNFYLIKVITNPQYAKHRKKHDKHTLPNTFKTIDDSNDIAMCDVTNAEFLPKSFLDLIMFNDQNIKSIKNPENERSVFISSAYNTYYFFTGGTPQKTTSDIRLTKINTFDVPIPQMGGCSGGSLLCVPKANNKYEALKTKIMGVVSSGAKSESKDQVECCPWIE